MTAQGTISGRVDASRVRPAGVSFTGSWPAVAAWGAGLVLAALGAGAIIGPESGLPARALGVVLFTAGLVSISWGGASLVRDRMPAPRAAIGGALAAILLAGALLIVAPARTSVLAVAAASVMLVVVAAAAARTVRRGASTGRAPSVWGLFLAAALAAVIVTPALGATQDAVLLRGDGTLPVVTHDGH